MVRAHVCFRPTTFLKLRACGAGYNVCVFAYGQSGTGKTFTMEGSEEHPGLVPRAMARIFEDIATRVNNYQHDCYLSMIEIYNENIRDLLRPPGADLSKVKFDIMRDSLVGMYVKDLTSEQVHTASHARKLIATGNVNRITASTGPRSVPLRASSVTFQFPG